MTLELPSEVRDRNFLFMPLQTTLIQSDEEYSKCGKWILTNHSGSLLWIDEVWKKLQVLLEEGTLIRIKASTAAMEDSLGNVMCFTKPGINEIKRAAEEIRKIVKYESCMYYKINSMTECGIDRRSGYRRVANYMHSFRGFLYKADENSGWILESDVDNQRLRPPISRKKSEKLKQDVLQLHSLPSKSRKMFLDLKSEWDGRNNNNLCIYTGCSMEEEEHGLTIADRLWIVGMKLMDEGYVKRMTCEKNVTKKAEFKFYFGKFPVCGSHFRYEPIVELCDTFYHKAHYYGFMYFRYFTYFTFPEYKKYTYSPEGELYEDHKFIFLKK